MYGPGRTKKALSLWLTVACAASFASAASAAQPATIGLDKMTSACHFTTVHQDDVTGPDTFTGTAEGVVVAMASPPGALHCEVQVNGAEVARTDSRYSQGILTTAGQITFSMWDSDAVSICTVVDWDIYGEQSSCEEGAWADVPAQEVMDAQHPAMSTFEGPYSNVPRTSNESESCSRAATLAAGSCGAGFTTPIGDLCAGAPDETVFGWWSGGTEFHIFDLHPIGNGVLDGPESPQGGGPVRYHMRIQAGLLECGGPVPNERFLGHMYAV